MDPGEHAAEVQGTPRTLAGLSQMAARAAWGEVLELSQDLLMRAEEADMSHNLVATPSSPPVPELSGLISMDASGSLPADDTDYIADRAARHDVRVQCGIYRIMGFLQTRRYIRAGQELDDQTRMIRSYYDNRPNPNNNDDDSHNDPSNHSSHGTPGSGLPVATPHEPFALRALALEVTARKGDITVVDQAYALRRMTLDGYFDAELQGTDDAVANQRTQRVLYILSLITGYCLRLQRHDGALDALREMARLTDGRDVLVMLAFVRVLLNLGDVQAAESAMEKVRSVESVDQVMVRLHNGLLYAARGGQADLILASKEFKDVLALQPDNMVAVNNLAICRLHFGDLNGALNYLETALRDNPVMALDEGLVFNLCTLYDLSCPDDANAKKQDLHRLAAKHGRQGFNMDSVTMQRSG